MRNVLSIFSIALTVHTPLISLVALCVSMTDVCTFGADGLGFFAVSGLMFFILVALHAHLDGNVLGVIQ